GHCGCHVPEADGSDFHDWVLLAKPIARCDCRRAERSASAASSSPIAVKRQQTLSAAWNRGPAQILSCPLRRLAKNLDAAAQGSAFLVGRCWFEDAADALPANDTRQ